MIFTSFKMPIFLEILFSILSIWFFQVRFSSVITPKNFSTCSLCNSVQFIFKIGKLVVRFFTWFMKEDIFNFISIK